MKHLKQLDNILQATSCKQLPTSLPMNFDDNLWCELGLQTTYTYIFLVLRKEPTHLLAVKGN